MEWAKDASRLACSERITGAPVAMGGADPPQERTPGEGRDADRRGARPGHPEREAALRAALASTSMPHVRDQFYVFAPGMVKGPCGANYSGFHWRGRGYRQYQCYGTTGNARERCDCRRIDANQLESAVWSEVTALLSDPERLLSMARDYLGLRREQVGVEREQLAAVRAKITKLERSLSETVVEYAKAGLPAAALAEATKALQGELEALRAHLGRLEAWQRENVAESERMRRLWELGDLAATRLGAMTPQQRRHVLSLLEVRVTVLGWDPARRARATTRSKAARAGCAARAASACVRSPVCGSRAPCTTG
jgi:hypothetical protein